LHDVDESRQRVLDKLKKELGATVRGALEDPEVVDVILNPDGKLWVNRLGKGKTFTGEVMLPHMALSMLGTVATLLQTEINRENPILQGELPIDGSRIEGVIPPITAAPVFAIRKKAAAVFPLSAYVDQGRMTEEQKEIIQKAIRERKNVLICGGTGSGKTTLGNAILRELAEQCPSERAVILEDTVELQCALEDKTELRTWGKIKLTTLLHATLRLLPDRIIVGEIRGAEVLDLLKSWNTGHPGGFATVHANDALSALTRLELLMIEADVPPNPRLIAEAVDIVVFFTKAARIGPKLQEIIEVLGFENGNYQTRRIA
jgi:type IV secretion system protein VirB11